MITKDFLLEIGVEEIPAGFIANATKTIKSSFENKFKQEKMAFESIEMFSTPRRFTIRINQLQEKQEDVTMERVGPAKRIAMDEEGNLSKAGQGFVRGAKAKPEDVYIKTTDKGEYIAVKVFIPGKDANILLKDAIKNIIEKLQFPKSMKWGSKKMLFARPIRWIVALFGDEVLPIEIIGLTSGRTSYGNRYQKLINSVEIDSPKSYEEDLKKVRVIANRNERKSIIEKQMNEILTKEKLNIIEDKKLLELVTDLVEYPTAVLGSFKESYLNLPEKIITSTLSQHQKYFSVRKENNELANNFVFISNGDPEHSQLIRFGNEKVITARLEDAQFFYQEDTKVAFDSYYEKLSEVTFQASLGSLKEKTDRIIKLVDFFAKQLEISNEINENAQRAAKLCKGDLVTLMLGEKEFTKLQGYMGKNYALKSGEKQEVADAIHEHYMPRGQNDSLPSSQISALVAIADKLDTVCGICGVDLLPTGSNDPFALRRAANGVVQIIENQNFDLNLIDCIDFAFSLLNTKLKEENHNRKFVYDFFKQRVQWLLEQNKIAYDVIESVMHIDFAIISDLKQRAIDIQSFRKEEDFVKLVLGFKRISNILSKAKKKKQLPAELILNPELFEEDAEKNLYQAVCEIQEKADVLLPKKSYHELMQVLVSHSSAIDNFFDKVLVNAEDEKVKFNRFALLNSIRKVFMNIADIAKIVVEG